MGLTLKPRIVILDFCDEQIRDNAGDDVAAQLAAQLSGSGRYQVLERSEWHHLLGGAVFNKECCLHPAWATQISNLAGADAVVIGSVCRSVRGRMTIAATMLDMSGLTLVKATYSTVEALAKSLCGNRLIGKIRIRNRTINARVTCVEGTLLTLNVGTSLGLKPGDRLRVSRILETVSDPYSHDPPGTMAPLTAGIGIAEVWETGPRATLARYTGIQSAQAGDLAAQMEI